MVWENKLRSGLYLPGVKITQVGLCTLIDTVWNFFKLQYWSSFNQGPSCEVVLVTYAPHCMGQCLTLVGRCIMDCYSRYVIPRNMKYMPRLGSRMYGPVGAFFRCCGVYFRVDDPMFLCMLQVIEEETSLCCVAVTCELLLCDCWMVRFLAVRTLGVPPEHWLLACTNTCKHMGSHIVRTPRYLFCF
jgi:hypothetical protein